MALGGDLLHTLSIHKGTGYGLLAITVIHKKGHRGSGTKLTRQSHRLAQSHHTRHPLILNEISAGKIRDLTNHFRIIGCNVDVLIVAKFCVNAQIGSSADAVCQFFPTAGKYIALHIQFQQNLILCH